MADLVEAFIERVRSVEPFARGGERRLAIRAKITESENILHRDRETRAIPSFLQRAKQRASEEIARHKRNNVSTRTAEFFQEVFEELSVRIRLTIREMPDDTFQVEVDVGAPGGTPHIVKTGFYSVEAARQWIDSDAGNTLIKAVIEKYER